MMEYKYVPRIPMSAEERVRRARAATDRWNKNNKEWRAAYNKYYYERRKAQKAAGVVN